MNDCYVWWFVDHPNDGNGNCDAESGHRSDGCNVPLPVGATGGLQESWGGGLARTP